jgi:hypothetical protein
VAQDILRGVENGQFSVATGLDGFMLANLTCGMEPVFSVLQAASQVGGPSTPRRDWAICYV